MNGNEQANGGAIALGVIGIVLSVIGFFVFGWLNIISVVLGIVGIALPGTAGGKVPGIISLLIGIVGTILWLVAVAAMM